MNARRGGVDITFITGGTGQAVITCLNITEQDTS